MEYTVVIADVAELTEEVTEIKYLAKIPEDSGVRSSDIDVTMTIIGKITFDKDKLFMAESSKAIAEWSIVKPGEDKSYKEVMVTYLHDAAPRVYTLSHAFVVSYQEWFEDETGTFELIVRQKKDRVFDGVTVD